MIDLKNKVIMISGANRGIGYATAKLLKEKGCILSLAARNSNDIKVGGDNVLKCTWAVSYTHLTLPTRHTV